HQVLHSLSAAVELARLWPELRVEVAATSEGVLDYARLLAAAMGPAPLHFRLLGPAWLRRVAGADGIPPKLPVLAASARSLGEQDVIVAPERTTAALRRFGVGARLVYTQHGAGDRAGPFEPRLGRFDLVFAAGAKQRDRMVGAGLVKAERCAVVGYPKFDLVDALGRGPSPPFAEDRPVVLYNPHFSAKLGSWAAWGPRILQAFATQRTYNLIFAPHLRLFGGADPRRVRELAPFLDHPAIHIDLGGTSAAVDMTYTRLADVYLGDVSSQIYEFLRQPRPCLFLNPQRRAWQSDESYRHWTFGPVLEDVAGLLPAVDQARRTHDDYRPVQIEGFRYTFDLDGPPSSVRAAEAIARLADSVAARAPGVGRDRRAGHGPRPATLQM
ncbi:MAG TPA: glycerophosphotransferase, partial [Phenylobacterium sp.]